ncbi:FAD-dependent monooxygenase, partial [Sphingobium fluviale]
ASPPASSWSSKSAGINGSLRRDIVGLLLPHYTRPHTEILTVPQSGTKTVPSQYFIIADGAQSEFRRKLNLRMEGETLFYNQAWYFRAPDLAKLFARTQLSSMTFFLNEDCYGDILIPQTAEGHWLYHVTPMPEGVEADDWPTFRNMLYRSIGEEFEVFEPQGRYFGSQVRLAASFNFGRALLIGDAAHLTSPFGGFGMNMGIGDAVDAGWKIAAILQGWGGPRLLETYTLERRDVCKYIIEGAAHNNKVSGKALVRPYMEEDSERGEKAREEVREFIIREKTQQSRSFGAQFGYRYTSSPIVVGDGTELPPLQYGEYTPSSVAGCRAPHLWLSEGNSIYDHFGPDFCLLKLDPAVDTTALEAAAAEVGIPLKVFLLDSDEARSLYERKLVLIRPDQHVAWRGNAEPDDCRWLVDVVRGAASFH